MKAASSEQVTQLLNAMSNHQGRGMGIRGEDLAGQLNLTPRILRLAISAAREDGIAICGKPNTGYFMPTTPEELHESCEFLKDRAMSSLHLLSRMQKVALPVLMGQLLLNQA